MKTKRKLKRKDIASSSSPHSSRVHKRRIKKTKRKLKRKDIASSSSPHSSRVHKRRNTEVEDCIDILREDAEMHILEDCISAGFDVVSMTANPLASPGSHNLDVFCAELEKFRNSARFKDAPLPIVMLAYHGTGRKNNTSILKTRVVPGTVNVHGIGAYFTPDISLAFPWGSSDDKESNVIVAVLLLDHTKYIFNPGRPFDEIVNSDAIANLPLFTLVLSNANKHEPIPFQNDDVVFTGFKNGLVHPKSFRWHGNASTRKRNVRGGKRSFLMA